LALILNIETATETCSVALALNGKAIGCVEVSETKAHAAKLTLFIGEVISKAGYTFNQLDAIAVSKGPGSYTGLRIGVSTAKGLCFALDKPLLAVNSLESFATHFKQNHLPDFVNKNHQTDFSNALLCPMIDARRMEVYTALYNLTLETIEPTKAYILDALSFSTFLQAGPVIFFGNGATKWHDIAHTYTNAWFENTSALSALGMIGKAEQLFEKKEFEDLAYFEPFYLKDFVSTQPRQKLV
jgi:tRNA threonylcarbamoyladenosine biosynthesis protein TsaB